MTVALRGFKYQLSPTVEQSKALSRWAGCCRYVFNQALEVREATYKATGKAPNYNTLAKRLTAWKRDKETLWLREAPAMALQQALLDLDAAYKRFFSGQNRRPRFRSRNHWRPSFRIPQDKNTLQVQRRSASVGRLKLPKLGWINFRWVKLPH